MDNLYLNYIVIGALLVSIIALIVSLVFLVEQLTRYYKLKTMEIEESLGLSKIESTSKTPSTLLPNSKTKKK